MGVSVMTATHIPEKRFAMVKGCLRSGERGNLSEAPQLRRDSRILEKSELS
jgi:hypothetical protein